MFVDRRGFASSSDAVDAKVLLYVYYPQQVDI
jgi:hypothetical protein